MTCSGAGAGVAAGVATEEPAAASDDFPWRLRVLVGLQRRFRGWAVWVDGTGRWTATRARPYRPGDGPGAPLLWVHAEDHDDLAAQMSRMREQENTSE